MGEHGVWSEPYGALPDSHQRDIVSRNGAALDLPGMQMPGLVLSLVGHLRHKPYFKMAADSMSIFFEGG